MGFIEVSSADFDAAALQAALRERNPGTAGAIVTFTGYVRDFAPGSPTQTLYLEHYPGMCERELADIGERAHAQWPIADFTIVHRVGALARSAQIVFVAVASAHRGDGFRACEFIIDALKTQAPFWKRETLSDGSSFWVEQRHADEERTARWQTGNEENAT